MQGTATTSVAERIAEEHQVIKGIIADLATIANREVNQKNFEDWQMALMSKIREFKLHLQEHFVLEVKSGFFEEVVHIRPRRSDLVKALAAEHDNFLDELVNVRDELAQSFRYDHQEIQSIKHQMKKIVHDLEEHERKETELLQDVMLNDIGAAD